MILMGEILWWVKKASCTVHDYDLPQEVEIEEVYNDSADYTGGVYFWADSTVGRKYVWIPLEEVEQCISNTPTIEPIKPIGFF